ncbi:synaptotagmin-like protein 2 isoform X4 [Mustela lutreola]|uniref:synaptotagmin-like protein 2 isoform X4 n=1 Tax=Mustela lutreola TaxID=9666 RepID=UPI002796E873|nr:synaptotagmin-like protein 2 isoform X4 [Mustela lutreola]
MRDDTILKENGSKPLLHTKVKLRSMESDSPFQGKGNTLPSRTCQNNNVNINPKSITLSQQGKEDPGILKPCEIYGPHQGNKTMYSSHGSKNRGEGNWALSPISNYPYSALKRPEREDQVPCNIKNVGSLSEEEPKLRVYEKNRRNSEVNFDSSTLVKEPSLKENMKAERESKEGDPCILKTPLETENIESLHGATKNKYSKKPEVQLQETTEVPKNQVQREKYKRVSERISFWEGEKTAAKLTHKEPTSSCCEGKPPAKEYQPVKSVDSLSTGQSECNQATSRQVVLDENGHTAHLSSFYSSNKPEEIRPQISGPSKNYPSVDQSGEVSPFQNKINEHIKRSPVAESCHYERDSTLPAWQHSLNTGSAVHLPLEKDKPLISESNPNFKVMSLKQRMDEPNTEQVYNRSQFENLRKFWDLGANPNSQENVGKNTNTVSQKYVEPFYSQKHKQFSDIKSSGKHIHEIGMLPGKKKILAREEIEKLNSKHTLQVLPDETTFPLGPSRKSTHHLPGNESSKENVGKNMKLFVTPVFKEEKDYSDQEVQESIVKTSALSKDYKDTFNDSLQKLLSEASSLAMHPSGGKVHGKQKSEPDISGNKTWPQDTGFAETEGEDKGHKESIYEHVDKTVAPPKVKPNTLTASLDKLLKEATGTSPCALPSVLEPVTTRISSEPEEGRVYEKGIEGTEWSHSTSAYQKELIAPFPKGSETLVNTALSQKSGSGECQPSTEDGCQVAAESSHPSGPPSHLYRKDSFGNVANSPQERPSSRDAHLAPQDEALPSQREISETVEKVILSPKPALNDINVVLQKLLREACYPVGREVVPGEVKAEFPKGVQAAGSPPNSTPGATMDVTVPDKDDFCSFNVVPDKTHNAGSYLAARVPPSEQTRHLCDSPVTQCGKELPQEVAEIVRETVIQPKSEFLEFSAGLEKLLKEATEPPSSKYESDPGTLSPSNVTGSEEEPSPVLKTLERSAARKMPSKSLEDISSDSPNQAKVDNLPEELVRSAEDDSIFVSHRKVSTVPSPPDNPFSHPDKLKRMSKSVPAFLQDESDDRETDTASESSYQFSRHKKSPSSLTNLSSSSGMTSLSSVSGSVMSVYSGDFGNLEVKGNIQFAIDYVDSLKELHVFVAQCKDLAAADVKKQRSDPYVKTYLLPDKGKMGKKKTLVVKKTLNPVYNEILRYKIEKQILKTQKLNLSVWHRDTFKRNSFLGEVELDLETWDWDNKQNKQLKWYPLKRKTAPIALEAENRGEMKLALQYVPEPIPGKKLPTTGEVHIWVKECLDLPQLRGSHLNSFVKCIILPDTSRKSRQKTRAVGKTTNPVFNHTMVYDGFRPEDLTEACVELTVWDHYKLTNQFLGGLRIGFGTGKSYGTEVDWMDSTSEEVALWEKMVNSPNTWIEATLPLRMLLIAKISK